MRVFTLDELLKVSKDLFTLFGVFGVGAFAILGFSGDERNYFLNLLGFCFLIIALVSLGSIVSKIPAFSDEVRLSGSVLIIHSAILFSVFALFCISVSTFPSIWLQFGPLLFFFCVLFLLSRLSSWLVDRIVYLEKRQSLLKSVAFLIAFFLYLWLLSSIRSNEQLLLAELSHVRIYGLFDVASTTQSFLKSY